MIADRVFNSQYSTQDSFSSSLLNGIPLLTQLTITTRCIQQLEDRSENKQNTK